jgi:hypothetical protein
MLSFRPARLVSYVGRCARRSPPPERATASCLPHRSTSTAVWKQRSRGKSENLATSGKLNVVLGEKGLAERVVNLL